MRIKGILLLAILIITAPLAYAVDVRPVVTEVQDQRSTGQFFFSNLEIGIKLLGDDASAVRAIRTLVDKAVDDTGRNILDRQKRNSQFKTLQGGAQAETTLRFRNPARKATVVKEVSGKLELFMPDRDPASTVLIGNILKRTAKPLDVPSLAKTGISVTVLTRKEYESLKKKEEEKGKNRAGDKVFEELALKMFERIFGGFMHVGENDLALKVSDPSAKVIDIDAVDKNGVRIKGVSTIKLQDFVILKSAKALPSDAQLRIFLKTRKSVVSVPLRLVDVALP